MPPSDFPLATPGMTPEPIFFCGVPPEQIEMANRQQFQWSRLRALRYCWIDRVPGITQLMQDQASRWAFDQWSLATNGYFQFTAVTDRTQANIILTTRPIDGVGRTLAETELPPGDDRVIRGWFDSGESWKPEGERGINFRLVFLHEMGHALGLGHISQHIARATMNPIYDPSLRTLQTADIEAIIALYPDAKTMPPPIVPPPVNPVDQITISVVLAGGTYHGNLSRLL